MFGEEGFHSPGQDGYHSAGSGEGPGPGSRREHDPTPRAPSKAALSPKDGHRNGEITEEKAKCGRQGEEVP